MILKHSSKPTTSQLRQKEQAAATVQSKYKLKGLKGLKRTELQPVSANLTELKQSWKQNEPKSLHNLLYMRELLLLKKLHNLLDPRINFHSLFLDFDSVFIIKCPV